MPESPLAHPTKSTIIGTLERSSIARSPITPTLI